MVFNRQSKKMNVMPQTPSQPASQQSQSVQFVSQLNTPMVQPVAFQSQPTASQSCVAPRAIESQNTNMPQLDQMQEISQTKQPRKKFSSKLLIIVLLVLLIVGGIFVALLLAGKISFGDDFENGKDNNVRSLSVPTAAKIKEVCEKNNGEYSETVSTIRRAFREILPNGTESITNHYCSIGIIITISDTDYLDLISMKAKQSQGAESEFPVRASSMAMVYTKVFSTSVKNPDGTIEEHKYTFTPIVDEIDYYKAYAGENGENDKGIFIVYKNAIVSASNAISDEYLNQLGLNKQ